MNLEKYFESFRNKIIGQNQSFNSPYGNQKIVYADWVASGRLYEPIEKKILEDFGPYVGNTHSESSVTGTTMTKAYQKAQEIIKRHVNASSEDLIITAGFGMTAVINKFQRILGIKVCEQLKDYTYVPKEKVPVVFLTHMEHHSNHTSWLETIADVEIINPNEKGLISLENLERALEKYRDRELKIGSFTACSNVTGIQIPYHQMAKVMHQNGGFCLVDFAASAPYVKIDMNPPDPMEKLDAIFFSPHKFLGGPGTSGVLVFNSSLYKLEVPDHPGGGTVDWTNPWGDHKYVNSIEAREDGGTPGFLQCIKTALAIQLKEQMGIVNILNREEEIIRIIFSELKTIPSLYILASEIEERLGTFSFYVEEIHYNLIVKLLNDRFGIQVRGGCSCAGTYGHYLLHVDPTRSKRITDKINTGDLSEKPGWVRMSIHPTMTNDDVYFIIDAIKNTIENISEWGSDYNYSPKVNEYFHKSFEGNRNEMIDNWFNLNDVSL